jgi:hypothetical protein
MIWPRLCSLAFLLSLLLPQPFSSPYSVEANRNEHICKILQLHAGVGKSIFPRLMRRSETSLALNLLRGGGSSGSWGGPWARDHDLGKANDTADEKARCGVNATLEKRQKCLSGSDNVKGERRTHINEVGDEQMSPRALAAAALEARLQGSAQTIEQHDAKSAQRSDQDILVRVRRLYKFRDKLPASPKKYTAQKRDRITKGVPKKLWKEVGNECFQLAFSTCLVNFDKYQQHHQQGFTCCHHHASTHATTIELYIIPTLPLRCMPCQDLLIAAYTGALG